MAPPRGLVYGFGINDVKTSCRIKQRDGSFRLCDIYCRWSNMIKRCYFHPKEGSKYAACEVSNTWRYLSKYTEWYTSNHIEGFVVDKDLLSGKIYSPETCLFIPENINLFIADGTYSGNLPSGVHFNKEKSRFCSRVYNPLSTKSGQYKHCGYTKTAEEATLNMLSAKSEYAQILSIDLDNPLAKKALTDRYKVGHWFYEDMLLKSRKVDKEWVL